MRRIFVPVQLIVSLSLAACGGAQGRADVEPEKMPPQGSFTGVWSSPQYGEMHMRQSGSHVIGRYEKDQRKGRIQGTVEGDLMRFQWEEKRELVRGDPTVTRGRGYFKYKIGQDGKHYLVGEWGLDDNETGGGPWRAYKLEGRKPEVNTSGGSQSQ
jgi:hypothetical protein